MLLGAPTIFPTELWKAGRFLVQKKTAAAFYFKCTRQTQGALLPICIAWIYWKLCGNFLKAKIFRKILLGWSILRLLSFLASRLFEIAIIWALCQLSKKGSRDTCKSSILGSRNITTSSTGEEVRFLKRAFRLLQLELHNILNLLLIISILKASSTYISQIGRQKGLMTMMTQCVSCMNIPTQAFLTSFEIEGRFS